VDVDASEFARRALARVAPGTPLRAGLDRILLARTGALIVLGDSPEVLELCTGGFLIEAAFSPQKLFELAKMDGAIILSANASRIVRANVHLVPDPRLTTSETGTRHRTAERVALSVDAVVVAVSEELSVISVYYHQHKRTLQAIPVLLSRANQALATLERYRERFDSVLETLGVLERRDQVLFRDLLFALQRGEMVRRIREEIDGYLLELGSDGRLLALQAAEISLEFDELYCSLFTDFLGVCDAPEVQGMLEYLGSLSTEELSDLSFFARAIRRRSACPELRISGLPESDLLTVRLDSRGTRLLRQIPRIPQAVVGALTEKYQSLRDLRAASEEDLASLPEVGHEWARIIRDFLGATESETV
jgi:diadenylate cyclase